MINFIDVKSGNVFNGSKPYCFWFDQGQSVGLNYVKNICVLSDARILVASVNDEVFRLLDVSVFSDRSYMENINQRLYYNLDDIKTNQIRSVGEYIKGYYVHMFYFLARSEEAGEIQSSFNLLREDNGVMEEFLIGADFYNTNEVLQSNLTNLGFSIPSSVQRAIYDNSPYEEGTDSITINRKYKELLLQYWDIIANKGSYNSLIDSLNWFEYGDLLHLEQYWKHMETKEVDMLEGHILPELMSDEMIEQLDVKVKTTYIGIYFTLNKMLQENGEITYQDNDRLEVYYDGVRLATNVNQPEEPTIPYGAGRIIQIGSTEIVNITEGDDSDAASAVFNHPLTTYGFNGPNIILNEINPKLINILTKWNHVDLSLKMTLVGNFFSTFFMPIHLDLIHSTIDKVVFTNAIKVLKQSSLNRVDRFESTTSMKTDIISNYKIVPVDAYVYEDTLFGQKIVHGEEEGEDDPELKYCGIETTIRESNEYIDAESGDSVVENPTLFIDHFFGKFGCVVKFICDITDEGTIKREMITWREGTDEETSQTFTRYDDRFYESTDNHIHIEFEVLLRKACHYNICLSFESTSGHTFTKQVELDITDDACQQINLYKLRYISPDYILGEGHLPSHLDEEIGKIVFQQQSPQSYYKEYSIFLSSTPSPLRHNGIGFNHTLVIDLDELIRQSRSDWALFNENHTMITGEELDRVWARNAYNVRALQGAFKYYLWFITDRYVEGSWDDEGRFIPEGRPHRVLIGICAFPYDSENAGNLGSKVFRVHLRTGSGIYPRMVDEYRFYPIFHETKPLTSRYINKFDVIMAVPQFLRSQAMPDQCTWKFVNASTGDVYQSQMYKYEGYNSSTDRTEAGNQGPSATLIGNYEVGDLDLAKALGVELLKPGYYNITLNYMNDKNEQSIILNSAFRINNE